MKKVSMPKAVQAVIFTLFVVALVAMAAGAQVVPKDPETKQLFYVLLGIMTTLLSVQTLTAAIQREDGFPPQPAATAPPLDNLPAIQAAAHQTAVALAEWKAKQPEGGQGA